MNIVLSEAERMALISVVKVEVGDLGPEIRHTNDAELKDQLRNKRKMLGDILQRLPEQPQAV